MGQVAETSMERTVEFASRAGALLLGNTAPADEVVGAILDITGHAGLADIDADVTYGQITVSHRPADQPPYVRVEYVASRAMNYGRYADAADLVQAYVTGAVDLDEAMRRVRAIDGSGGRYPSWLIRAAAGATGSSTAVFFGAGWVTAVVAFVATMVIDWLLGALGRRGWPVFFVQAFTGVVAVLATGVVELLSPGTDSSQAVVAVIIMVLAGITSTGAIQDLITGWYLTGLGRLAEAVMNTVGLIIGIRGGIALMHALGNDLVVTPDVQLAERPLGVLTLVAAAVALSYCVYTQMQWRSFLPVLGITALAWVVFRLTSGSGVDQVWASGAGAVVTGVCAVVLAGWLRVPASVLASIAIIPLLPGVLLYRGLLAGPADPMGGLSLLLVALGTGLALAGGVLFGEYLAAGTLRKAKRAQLRYLPRFLLPFRDRQGRRDREDEDSDRPQASEGGPAPRHGGPGRD